MPKYLQVANHYRDLIASGELAPGAEVPSERQLADAWGISRPTATRALAALRNLGLVEARQGSGTYVREHVQLNRRARDRYLRSRQSGRIYGPGEHAEIVSAIKEAAPEWVARSFALPDGALAIARRRVTHDESGAVEVSTSWFPAELADVAPKLLRTQRIREGTLAYVEAATGRRATYARDQVSARLATAAERRMLGIEARTAAVLVIHHVAYDRDDRPLECVEAVYPPERWDFEQQYAVQ